MSNLLRTPEGAAAYDEYRANGCLEENGCVLCSAESIEEFEHWRIIPNHFPYNRIAEIHHMLIPKRHTTDLSLTEDERNEYERIKHEKLHTYDYFIETNERLKSIPAYFHLHLIIGKEVLAV